MKPYNRGITFITADPIHHGHIMLINLASQLCDHLIVCVASDEDIRERKNREPYFELKQRLLATSCIKGISELGIQLHQQKEKCIEDHAPDVIFVSEEYKDKDWDGKELGLPVHYLPYTKGVSSTHLRNTL